MKILKIEFQNINSLKGSHKIDFTDAPFTGSSLFAITGPTGSGKSTILDVISLALFNQVPRLGKISKNEIIAKGAILTRNQKEAFAHITYESKSGRYISKWSISTARTGNLRDYNMEIIEEASDTLLDIKKSDVPAKNEELIGLNYNQFIKSVLLAQGEFAQFLKARKDERGELLEKITGTGIYRQLGQKAFEKYKEVNRNILQQQNKIETLQEQLLEEEKHSTFSGELKEKEAACKPLEKEIETLTKGLELKKIIETQYKEIIRLEEQKLEAEKQLKQFEEEHGFPLKQHEKVQDYADELRSWNHLKKEINSLKEELISSKETETQNEENLKTCLLKAAAFVGSEVTSGNFEEVLSGFTRKIQKIQEAKKEKQIQYTNLKDQLQRELKEVTFQLTEQDLEKSLQGLREKQASSEAKIRELHQGLEGINTQKFEKEKLRLQKDLEQSRDAWRQVTGIENISAEIKKLEDEEKTIAPKMKQFPEEIKEAEVNIAALKDRQEILNLKKQNEFLRASLEEHRQHLKDNEPCPLCGALHHPFAQNLPKKDDKLQEEIKTTENKLNQWKDKLSAATASLKHFKERQIAINNQQEQLIATLKTKKSAFRKKFEHLAKDENADWEVICNNYHSQINQLEQFEKEGRQLSAISAGVPLLKKLKEVLTEGKRLKEKLKNLYTGIDIQKDTQLLQTQWIRLQQEQKNIAVRQKEILKKSETKNSALRKLEQELLPAVTQRGFESVEHAKEALMIETECKELRVEKENIQKQINEVTTSLKLLDSQLKESKKRDVNKSREELTRALEQQKDKLEIVGAECRELDRILKNHSENLERLKKIQTEIADKEKQIKRWRLLNELIGDSVGKKFNDFAQDLSLNQLLKLANIRLKDLSDRYAIDKPAEDEDDGLVAIDEHMGGQRRSVKTLSGGETFILSLSMALALSDLASRNVEINSLFIDEGFGTLDPETLDQTLDTLEKLQAESSKTIGIISHVDSLKERIATQIQLKRNGQGYSSLEVS